MRQEDSYGDLEERAEAMLPRAVYDFYAGGAGTESTLDDNVAAWRRVRLRPRVLRDVSRVDTATALLGTPVATPVMVAPTAYHRLAHDDGEVATAKGTAAAGSLLTVSSRVSRRIEDVAAAAGAWWFQVYVMRDRDLTRRLVERAAAAGAGALVLTGDTPYLGKTRQPRGDLPGADFFVNLGELDDRRRAEQAHDVTTSDIGWLRDVSGLPVLVKGVLRGDEARRCVDAGASGVIVSNHGGRQLDGALATADALPDVVAALGRQGAEVYVDGGVRDGTDVLRALALGARGVLVGRGALWALATAGADGVQDMLAGLTGELAHAMALAGAPDLSAVTRDLVQSA